MTVKSHVPNIAILGTLIVQSALATFWAGTQAAKLENIGLQLERVEANVKELQRENRSLGERLARIEK